MVHPLEYLQTERFVFIRDFQNIRDVLLDIGKVDLIHQITGICINADDEGYQEIWMTSYPNPSALVALYELIYQKGDQ